MKAESGTLPKGIEGAEAFKRFDAVVDELLAVPHSTLVRREKAYRRKVEKKPTRRGPKRRRSTD